jgi:hypothetical protein
MKKIKNVITKVGFFALRQGCQSASRFNSEIREELTAWPEGFTILLRVLPRGPKLGLQKKNGRLKGISTTRENWDLTVVFRTEETAFRVITTLSNVPKAFTQNRLMVFGNTADSMILIRVLNVVQAYLFPPFLSKRVLKRVPKFSLGQHIGRLRLYTIGLALGK